MSSRHRRTRPDTHADTRPVAPPARRWPLEERPAYAPLYDPMSERARAGFRQELAFSRWRRQIEDAQRAQAEAQATEQATEARVVPVLTPDSAPDSAEASPVGAPGVIVEPTPEEPRTLGLGGILATVEAHLRAHPEVADVCALRGMTPGETRLAVARELFGDALLTPIQAAGITLPPGWSAQERTLDAATLTPGAPGEEEEPCPPTPLQPSAGMPRAARSALRLVRGGKADRPTEE